MQPAAFEAEIYRRNFETRVDDDPDGGTSIVYYQKFCPVLECTRRWQQHQIPEAAQYMPHILDGVMQQIALRDCPHTR